jgi:hypothetical protein
MFLSFFSFGALEYGATAGRLQIVDRNCLWERSTPDSVFRPLATRLPFLRLQLSTPWLGA